MSDRRDFAIEPQLLHSFPPIDASALHRFSPVLPSMTYRCRCWVCMFPAAVILVPDADCPDAVAEAVVITTGTVSEGLSTKIKSAFPSALVYEEDSFRSDDFVRERGINLLLRDRC